MSLFLCWTFFKPLKGQCHEILTSSFFSWLSFPQAPEYTISAVPNIFENLRRYSQFNVHHRCCWHRWQMKKIFNQKNFNSFVWTPLGRRVNIYMNFCLQVHFKVSAAWYCSHYFPPVSLTPVANLPPVSLIPVAICHQRRWYRRQICRRYRWHRWQKICHRCQQHKRNWWQNLPPVSLMSLIPVANFPPVSLIPTAILPPVSLTPVVHLDLRIAPWIFEKVRNDPNVIFRGLGEGDSWKKTWSKKSRDTVPLNPIGNLLIIIHNEANAYIYYEILST